MSAWGDMPGPAEIPPRFPVATICGSLRYYPAMLQLAEYLTSQGHIVLMPHVANYAGGKPSDELKVMLDRMHLAKIDMAQYVYIVGSHIGNSTREEIEYSESHDKTIYYVADPSESVPLIAISEIRLDGPVKHGCVMGCRYPFGPHSIQCRPLFMTLGEMDGQ